MYLPDCFFLKAQLIRSYFAATTKYIRWYNVVCLYEAVRAFSTT